MRTYVSCHICLELDQETAALEGSLLCDRHEQRLWLLLDRIGIMWRTMQDPHFLAGTVEPPSEYGSRSQPPCSLAPIVVADHRSRAETGKDLVSAPRVLWAWSLALAEAQGLQLCQSWDLAVLIPFLKRNLPWIQRQPAVTRFARHIGAVHHSLRRVTNYD